MHANSGNLAQDGMPHTLARVLCLLLRMQEQLLSGLIGLDAQANERTMHVRCA